MPATRIDYKRELPELYAPGAEPAIVDVPELAFLMVDGHGDPNTAVEYREAVEALFAVSYATKFVVTRAPGAVDFAVMPLEGLWWVPDMSKFTMKDKSAASRLVGAPDSAITIRPFAFPASYHAADVPVELVLELAQPADSRHLGGLVCDQRVERAGQEARGSQRCVPVARSLGEHRAGRGNDVAGDGRDSEEDAAEQIDRRLPPSRAAAHRQQTVPGVAR